jgi:hypothetical protein
MYKGGSRLALETAPVIPVHKGIASIRSERESYDLKSITDQIEAAGFPVPH